MEQRNRGENHEPSPAPSPKKRAAAEGRLWVVSELYYPETSTTGYILTKISEDLAKSQKVSVLCGYPNYQEKGTACARKETYNNIDIVRCRSTTFDKNRLLKRLINMATLCWSMWFALFFRIRKNDKVLVVTNPPLLPFVVMSVCALRRMPFFLLVHDVYPEFLVTIGLLREKSFTTRILNRLNALLYKRSRRILVLGRDMKELILKKTSKRPEDIFVVPNFSDLEEIKPEPREQNKVLIKNKLQDKFVIQCMGNLGPAHDFQLVAEAAKQLKSHPEIVFLFAGSGKLWEKLEHLVEKESLTNIVLLAPFARDESCLYHNACDVAMSVFVPGMKGISVPSRAYNILAAGKPILAVTDPEAELALVIQEEGIGWTTDSGDVNGFIDTVLEAYRQREDCYHLGQKARRVAEQKYSVAGIAKLFQEACTG